jgi:broad specificity phosphatase PhoE
MSVSELLLVRHGESEGNVAAARAHEADAHEIDVPARDPDVALSDLGRQQAAAVGAVLGALPDGERPHAIACSPYVRARETARLACDAAGLELPTRVDERLRDRELGVLDRLTFAGSRPGSRRRPNADGGRGSSTTVPPVGSRGRTSC